MAEAHLRRAVELAGLGLEVGEQPFGAVLVAGDGEVVAEERNRTIDGDPTAHAELLLARHAARHLATGDRRAATVYTSGEPCPMCAGALGWAGLGRVVMATSSAQLRGWLAELGVVPPPVAPLPLATVLPDVAVVGPVDDHAHEVRDLHRRYHTDRGQHGERDPAACGPGARGSAGRG